MKRMFFRAMITAFFLSFAAGAGFSQEATEARPQGEGAERERKTPTVNFDATIAEISSSDNEARILDAIEEALSRCAIYDDYELLASDIKGISAQKPDFKRPDLLNYAIARIRMEQLGFLSKQNDIESGRLYMNVNENYRGEAVECLDKAAREARSKELILDVDFLKFLILKDTFQYQKIDAFLDGMASRVASYSDDDAANRARLAALIGKFDKRGLADYAMKLKLYYVSKISPAAAQAVFEAVLAEADRAFAQGNMKGAGLLYDNYIKSGRQYFERGKWASGIMEIAEKYFASARYKEARGYYEYYLENYPDSNVLDYCSYRIGLCYYNEKNEQKAISHFENFLDTYKNSVWFDRAFEALCRLYFMSYTKESAITGLQRLIDKYYRKNTGDYARLLIAILHYNDHEYDTASQLLKKIPQDSVYYNDADMLSADIGEIKSRKAQPAFSYGTKDTYKVWEQYMVISAALTPYEMTDKKLDAALTDSGVPQVRVKPGTKIKLTIDPLVDLDRYMNYQQDQEDISRLPRKIEEATEKDLISISWSCDYGKFQDENQTIRKTWLAPAEPGTGKISVLVDDLGLVRKPDRGPRKDAAKELAVIVVVE